MKKDKSITPEIQETPETLEIVGELLEQPAPYNSTEFNEHPFIPEPQLQEPGLILIPSDQIPAQENINESVESVEPVEPKESKKSNKSNESDESDEESSLVSQPTGAIDTNHGLVVPGQQQEPLELWESPKVVLISTPTNQTTLFEVMARKQRKELKSIEL